MKYPPHIETIVHETSCNFYKEKLIVNKNKRYSLHTECSYGERTFSSAIVNKFPFIKRAEKRNIPQLWFDKKWAHDFYKYIKLLIGNNSPPDVLEIHPPFNDYCSTFKQFLGIFNAFYHKFKRKYPTTNIVIENRFGTRYTGGKFLLSKCSDVLEFCDVLSNSNIDLKIALDYPQLFSAEVIKGKKEENWMGPNPLQLLETIVNFNKDIKKYKNIIGGFHMWGKRKTKKRWIPHAGNFDTFFSNSDEFKHIFLSSVFSTFNDGVTRYFVPEVNSGVTDLHFIVGDMEKYGFKFI
jgi:hypothetical protein